MASFSYRFAAGAAAVLATSVIGGCAGEDAEQQAKFPQAPGSDSFHQMLADDAQEQQQSAEEVAGAGPGVGTVGPEGQGDPIADSYADTDPSALTDFHSTLDPYGQWIEDPNYGTMWQPSQDQVGSDFAPYVSGGHWGYDDASEYVWMSDYGWGWAPFHYGRWAYGGTGWGWIPGRAYAPAWVSWRTGYPGFGYVGWAPMAPSYYWGQGGVAYGLATIPPTPYVFCGTHNLFTQSGLQGRIVSNPTEMQAVAGQTHTYAPSGTTTPPGRVAAHPTVEGPSPKSLNLSASEVNHVSTNNPQLSHAMQFSRPSTAVAMGAHAPFGSTSANKLGSAGRPGALPGGAVAGHAQMSRPSMPAYGGSAGGRSYYSNLSQNPPAHIGDSYYGHGGTYRSYGAPTGPHLAGPAKGGHPAAATTNYPPSTTVHPTTTQGQGGHFGGHYGGGAHGGGGHR
jgi:hypothetical protein